MMRMGMVIGVRADRVAEYKALHAEPWPEMDAALKEANIHQYSIFLKEPENLLFGVWDYRGTDYEGDMKRLGEKAVTKRWLALTDPCQSPLASARQGEWWSFMDCVYHLD
ncbi:L-rhamnose mutarotase [Rhizobium sp.]